MTLFQSTHPSGVRRQVDVHGLSIGDISIHAPQWGATASLFRPVSVAHHFNPRTPVGCDLFPHRNICDCLISIHAPQWGATRRIQGLAGARGDFNPRTPVGCDDIPPSIDLVGLIFQSTHPSGVRLAGRPRRIHIAGISIHAPQWGATRR